MTDETKPEPRISIHVLTSGETRNPIGSKASPHTWVSDAGGVYMVSLAHDGKAFDTEVLGEEEPMLEHLEAYIREHALVGTWKLSIVTPLWDASWERNAEGDWLCTQAGEGYA